MTPQEKAESLVEEFYQYTNTNSRERAKACARIAVDQTIEALKDNAANSASWLYYEEVKQEIDKIPAFKE